MFEIKKIVILAAFATSASASMAVNYNWGPHDPSETNSPLVTVGSFSDLYTFTVTGLNAIAGVAVTNNVVITPFPGNTIVVYNITGGIFSLWRDNGAIGLGGGDVQVGSNWIFDGTTGSTSRTASLNTGSYYYLVSGTATGTSGGLYTIASALQPVPEPETYALMLAGLGVVGFVAARRRNRG